MERVGSFSLLLSRATQCSGTDLYVNMSDVNNVLVCDDPQFLGARRIRVVAAWRSHRKHSDFRGGPLRGRDFQGTAAYADSEDSEVQLL